jgi:NAD(P)-dependent dehydrogenase (short-subunit alcohol dehydrogenase family)
MGRMDDKVAFVTGAARGQGSSHIGNTALFLTSDEARYITGVALPVDAGSCLK